MPHTFLAIYIIVGVAALCAAAIYARGLRLWVQNLNDRPQGQPKGPMLAHGRAAVSSSEHDAAYLTLEWSIGPRAGWGLHFGVRVLGADSEGCPVQITFCIPFLNLYFGLLSDRWNGWAHRLSRWWARQSFGLDRQNPMFESHCEPGRMLSRVGAREYSVRVFEGKLWLSLHEDWTDSVYGWSRAFGLVPREMYGVQRLLKRVFRLTYHVESNVTRHERAEVPLPEGVVMGAFTFMRREYMWVPSEWMRQGKRTYDPKCLEVEAARPPAPARALIGRLLARVFEPKPWSGWNAEFDEPGLRHPGRGTTSYNCGEDATSSISFGSQVTTLHDAVGQAVAGCLRERYRYGGLTWRPAEKPSRESAR